MENKGKSSNKSLISKYGSSKSVWKGAGIAAFLGVFGYSARYFPYLGETSKIKELAKEDQLMYDKERAELES
ncbi:hypothetical protein [Sporocytophaga myxococcoides]|uniref:hypothetical protein n=1 Tax=Sporocytophaga myxococcoides TaxID=153721 RepID=UPI0003F7FDAB|nr:hypothetical protein [Sporocytophaga myxococcoides]